MSEFLERSHTAGTSGAASQAVGRQSIGFTRPPAILGGASVVGSKEGDGPLGHLFDRVNEDPLCGKSTWEQAESEMQRQALALALGKLSLEPGDVRYLFAGDLLGQIIATSFGARDMEIPLFGLYGACSTIGEALQLGAMAVGGGYAGRVACVASSHLGSAEKQFRFPMGYGNQRPLSATWTVTGAGAFILGEGEGYVRITGITTGKIVDYGVKDSMNMGACMAPAAADTIAGNLEDFGREPEDYDRIITGDLGAVGKEILLKLLRERGYDIDRQHTDCGLEIYDRKRQDVHSGGSGCGCAAATLSAYILDQIAEGHWRRVLFVPTGALLSTVSFNEGESVPGIAHGVVLEG